jgi:4-amino-4-deoxychorismate lyase
MSLLVESLRLQDGVIRNLEYHQDRLNRSMDELFPQAPKIDLSRVVSIPADCSSGIFKIRVLYGNSVAKIEIEPYVFRKIQSLKIVRHESIDYHLKYSDRQILQELYAQRCDCDDIIIIRNGMVTDSFAANLLFLDGNTWVTPTTPLLAGTQRQYLLDRDIIAERVIREEDIRFYQQVGLINAMVDFEEMPVVPVEQICF